jgi:LysM repeat protein
MSTENNSTKICPTCGTRIRSDAERCIVCGTELSTSEGSTKPTSTDLGSRIPKVTLSLPAAIGLLAIFLAIGALLVYFAIGQTTAPVAEATATPTITMTPAPSTTPTPITPTATYTPLPSPTPISYTVKLGESCLGIALAFNTSVQSIVLLNNLPADCGTLYEGQKLLIPQPTPTPTPLPTATLSAAEATVAACQILEYTVQANDTLSSIAANYAVPQDSLREWNGLVNNVVRLGQKLIIPLCDQYNPNAPTPTATVPPPYSAPNPLLPPDGAPFSTESGGVSLQWASVGTLRENESYQITIEDVTEGEGRKLIDYLIDTKFLIPQSFLPNEPVPHVLRWWVTTVRQVGTDDDGNPLWESAGATSNPRVFTWTNTIGAGGNETPVP